MTTKQLVESMEMKMDSMRRRLEAARKGKDDAEQEVLQANIRHEEEKNLQHSLRLELNEVQIKANHNERERDISAKERAKYEDMHARLQKITKDQELELFKMHESCALLSQKEAALKKAVEDVNRLRAELTQNRLQHLRTEESLRQRWKLSKSKHDEAVVQVKELELALKNARAACEDMVPHARAQRLGAAFYTTLIVLFIVLVLFIRAHTRVTDVPEYVTKLKQGYQAALATVKTEHSDLVHQLYNERDEYRRELNERQQSLVKNGDAHKSTEVLEKVTKETKDLRNTLSKLEQSELKLKSEIGMLKANKAAALITLSQNEEKLLLSEKQVAELSKANNFQSDRLSMMTSQLENQIAKTEKIANLLDSQTAKTEEVTSQLISQVAKAEEMSMIIHKMGDIDTHVQQRLTAGGPSLHSSSFLQSDADNKYCKPARLFVTADGNIIIYLGKPNEAEAVLWSTPGYKKDTDTGEKNVVLWSTEGLKKETPWWSKLSKKVNHGSFELRLGFHGALAMTNTENRRIVWRSMKKKLPHGNYVASLNCSTGHIVVELEDKLIWTSADL